MSKVRIAKNLFQFQANPMFSDEYDEADQLEDLKRSEMNRINGAPSDPLSLERLANSPVVRYSTRKRASRCEMDEADDIEAMKGNGGGAASCRV
eukprot:gene27747-34514_t